MNVLKSITKLDRVELALVAVIAILMSIAVIIVVSASYNHYTERVERQATMKCHNMYRTEVPCP